jgi:tetratricopeptide (TPR) repeat protein
VYLNSCRHPRARYPNSKDIALQLAVGLHKIAERDEAIDELKALLTQDEGNASAWFTLGLIYQDSNALFEAVSAYRRCLEVNPELPEAYVNLGICLQDLGDLPAAKETYGRAMHLRQDSFGRIAQAITSAPKGELWLHSEKLRRSLLAAAPGPKLPAINSGTA